MSTSNMDDPISLFKYRSLSEEKDKERVREIFEDHKVWFSKPKDFNDPFEFQFTPSFDATTYEKIEAYAHFLKKKNSSLTNNAAIAKATSDILAMGESGVKKWEHSRLVNFRNSLANTGVFSLTEYRNDILMWSHYADKHRGICIKFCPIRNGKLDDKLVDFYCQAFKVNYPDGNDLPIIHLYKYDLLELVQKSVLTKARHWEYEGEWRILDVRGGPGKKPIPEGIISSVILGCQIEKEVRKWVIDLTSKYPTPVTIYETRIRPNYYELEFRKI